MQLNQFILAELFSKPEILIQNALLRRKQKEGLKVQSIVFPNEYNHGKLLYFKKIAELKLNQRGSLKKLREDFTEFAKKFPQKYLHGTQNEDSTGDYLNQTQRCTDCYDLATSQDCKYVSIANNAKACYDITVFGANSMEFCCENHEVGQNVRNIFYSDQVWEGCYEVYYSKLCMQNSHDLFGCIGLKHKSFCILNKQYTPEDYEILKQKIIKNSTKLSPFLKSPKSLIFKRVPS